MTRFHIHQDITRCDLSKKACTIERARLTEASRTLTRRNARTTSRSALGSHLNTTTALRLLLRKSHFTCYSIQAKDIGTIFCELARFWLPAILFHPTEREALWRGRAGSESQNSDDNIAAFPRTERWEILSLSLKKIFSKNGYS